MNWKLFNEITSRVFDREGLAVAGGGATTSAISWNLSQVGSAIIMVLTIGILAIKFYKAIRDIKKPSKD